MKLDLMSTFFLLSKNSFVILWKDVWNPPKLLHSSIYPRKLVGGFFQGRQQFCSKPQSAEGLECAIIFGNMQRKKIFFPSYLEDETFPTLQHEDWLMFQHTETKPVVVEVALELLVGVFSIISFFFT